MVRAVSVTRKRTVRASFSRTTLPASTRPPMRKARSRGASLDATWLGVKKNTRFDWNAFSTSVAAMPSAASPETIHNALLVLGFNVPLLLDTAQRPRAARPQRHDLDHERKGRGAIGHPDIESGVAHSALTQCVRRSRSRMMARTRVSAAPIEYIQKANAISSIPHSIATCIDDPLKLTLEPWCSV